MRPEQGEAGPFGPTINNGVYCVLRTKLVLSRSDRPGWCVAPGYRNHERPIRYGEQFNLTNSDDNRVKAPRRLDWLAFRPITLRKASDFVQKVPYGHHPQLRCRGPNAPALK